MPNRVIREAILDSDRYHSLASAETRLLFFELILLADDYGLTQMQSSFLRRRTSACSGRSDEAIARMCLDLADADLVRVYEVSGNRYGYIPRFRSNVGGRMHKQPKWPLPPDRTSFNEIKALQEKCAGVPENSRISQQDADADAKRLPYQGGKSTQVVSSTRGVA